MTWLRSRITWFDARRRIIALMLAGLLVLMVVSAGRESDDSEWVAVPDLSWLLAGALGLSAITGLITLIVVRPRMQSMLGDRKRMTIRNVVVTLLILAALVLILDGQQLLESGPEEATTEQPTPTDLDSSDDSPTAATSDSGEIAALVILAALAAVALAWSRSRDKAAEVHPAMPTGQIEPELGSAVDQAVDFLQHGGDPRESVMAAYAILEQALTFQHRGRAESETPTEHMARVLHDIPTLTEPAVQLGHLYELARFSETPITSEDQRNAAAALDRSRRELATLTSGRR